MSSDSGLEPTRLHSLPSELLAMCISRAIEYSGCEACQYRPYIDVEQALILSMVSETCMEHVRNIMTQTYDSYLAGGRHLTHWKEKPPGTSWQQTDYDNCNNETERKGLACPMYGKYKNEVEHTAMMLGVESILSHGQYFEHKLPYERTMPVLKLALTFVRQRDDESLRLLRSVIGDAAFDYHRLKDKEALDQLRLRAEGWPHAGLASPGERTQVPAAKFEEAEGGEGGKQKETEVEEEEEAGEVHKATGDAQRKRKRGDRTNDQPARWMRDGKRLRRQN